MIFIKRIPSIEENPLETSQVVVDRQLRHIALLDANRDCVYLLTTIMVLHHMIEFKTNFERDHKYSMQATLKTHRTIKNSRSFGMLGIMFGRVKERDVLAISYYNGLVQIYQNRQNWSNLSLCLNLSPRLARVQLIDSTLYTIQYSKDVQAYDISNNGACIKSSIVSAQQIILQTRHGVIYESPKGDLMNEKQVILKVENKKKENYIEDLQTTNFMCSFCQRYIVRLRPSTIFKLQKNKVTKVCDLIGFPTMVSISPFSYEVGDVVLLVYQNLLELRRLAGDKYKMNPILLQIKNIKHTVQKIIWIGPYQLLLLDQEEKMTFLEIFSSKLVA